MVKKNKIKENKEKVEKQEIEQTEEKTENQAEKEEKKELTLEEKYEQVVQENNELKDKLLRRAAEFENFRKRSFTEKSDWIKNANQRLIIELCDVSDNFERALNPETEKKRKAFEDGIQMIYKQLNDLLTKEGVEKIEALEQEFDPQLHEALAHIPSDYDEDIVAAVIRNGYKMNDKVIRAARVAVSNGEKPQGASNQIDKKKKKKRKKK